jgi:hypothetical protein
MAGRDGIVKRGLQMYGTLVVIVGIIFCSSFSAYAQRRKGRGSTQTSFGSEMPIHRPARITADVVKQILEFDPEMTENCGVNESDASGDLAGSSLDINGDGVRDLVTQATGGCFMGAHATHFWVFSKAETRLAPGYDLVFAAMADYLEVLRTKTNGFRDIETGNHTAVEMYMTLWKFDGEKYQAKECAVENFETRKRVRILCQR